MYPRTLILNPSGSGAFTFATLPAAALMSGEVAGVQAYTSDEGMCYWDGAAWHASGAAGEGLSAPTYAAARLLSGVTTGDRLQVLGRTTQSDGGQGLFTWVAGGSTTIDDGFELAAPGGIWRRADTSFVTYEMFGAVPMASFSDVSHDSTAAINACHLALPPPSSTTRLPFKIQLNGLYGISGTVNFLELAGIEFYGITNFSELGSGYIWIAAADPAVDMIFMRGCRYLKFRRLRVSVNAVKSTSAAAMLSAFCLSSDIITSIQERCTWEDVTIGNRDGYNISSTGYDFQNGFRTAHTGTPGNNDFHLFESVRMQNVQYGWNNQESQATGWVGRNCKVYLSDTAALIKATRMTFFNFECNGSAQAVFVLGLGASDAVRLYIKGYVSQTNHAEFAVLTGTVDITVDDGNFDGNRDANNVNIINSAHPLFIDATGSASTNVIRLINPQFFQIPPLIDFGTASALRHLIVKGGSDPTNIALVNHTGVTSQRIVYEWEPGGGQSATIALGGSNWAPVKNLLFPPYTSVSISGVTITGTAGQFAGTLSGFKVGQYLKLSGVYGGTGSITGYVNPTTYYVSATDGVSTFTLQSPPGTAIVTTAGTPTGITYTPSIVADPNTHEIALSRVRFGRRNVAACTDLFNTATVSGTINAGATYTFTNALPVGLILGVSLHISSAPAGPANIQIGDGTTAARWGTRTNAANSATTPPASLVSTFTDAGPTYNKAVGNVVLTASGGTGSFSGGGVVKLTVHYIDFAQSYYDPNLSG